MSTPSPRVRSGTSTTPPPRPVRAPTSPASRAPPSVSIVKVRTCISLMPVKCAKCTRRVIPQQRARCALSDVAATRQIVVRIPGNQMSQAVGTHENEQRGAWGVLAILTSINLLNYIDRFVFPAVSESIKHSALHPTDTAIGLGSTAFLAVYLVTAPFFGAVGDRPQRTRWVAAGILLWSAA